MFRTTASKLLPALLTRRVVTAYRTTATPFRSPPSPALAASFLHRYASSATGASSTFDPQEVSAQEALDQGNSALEIGDLDAAKEKYEESLKIKKSAVAHYNLGVVLYQQQDLPGAIINFEASIALTPPIPIPSLDDPSATPPPPPSDDPTTIAAHLVLSDTHTNLGAAYILSKPARPDLALSHLQKALELNPDDGETVYNLAAVLEALGEEHLDESLVAYNRALSLGIQRAEINVRNISAKILGKRLKEEAEEKKKPKDTTATATDTKSSE